MWSLGSRNRKPEGIRHFCSVLHVPPFILFRQIPLLRSPCSPFHPYSRPISLFLFSFFPVSTLLGSYTEKYGPELYMIEPSGVSFGYYGCAVGKGQQAAQSEIEKLDVIKKKKRKGKKWATGGEAS